LQLVGELKDGGWGHAISLIAKHASRAISICIPVQIWPRQIEEAAGKLALIVQTKSATIHLHNKRPARVPFSETVVQNPESSIHKRQQQAKGILPGPASQTTTWKSGGKK